MKRIFVTVASSESVIPILNKVAVDIEDGGERKAAKNLRHEIAKEQKVPPSSLSWGIFDSRQNNTPILASGNWSKYTLDMEL